MVQLSKEEIKRVLENNHRSESIDKLFELFAQHLNDRLKEKEAEIAELKEQLESKKDECNEYAANCNKYHDLYLSKDGENKQLRVTMAHQDSQSAQYSRTYSDLLKQKDDEIAKLQSTISEQQDRIGEWISVEDRLPEKYCQCLVYCPNSFPKNSRVLAANYYDDDKLFYCDAFEQVHEDVTHWMPLPQSPESLTKKQD